MLRRFVPLLALAVVALALPGSASAYVYWSTGNGNVSTAPEAIIGRANLDGSDVNPSFVSDYWGQQPIAADATHVYFTSAELSFAEVRTNPDGSERTELPGVGSVAAVDNEHIYWIESGTIGRAKLDGSDPEPEFVKGILGQPESGGIAVYGGFVYWAGYSSAFGDTIGRASLITREPENEFVKFAADTGPRGIAVDQAGIFWTNNPDSGTFTIGHVGLGGGTANQNYIGGANVAYAGIAIEGTTLYWDSYDESSQERTIARAELEGAEAEGSGASVDLNFIKLGSQVPKWLAVNGVISPPPPPPPPPPGPSAGTNPVQPNPVPPNPVAKPLRCKKGFRKQTVKGKKRCVKVKKHHKRHRAHG